jgi:hypothetical protein
MTLFSIFGHSSILYYWYDFEGARNINLVILFMYPLCIEMTICSLPPPLAFCFLLKHAFGEKKQFVVNRCGIV